MIGLKKEFQPLLVFVPMVCSRAITNNNTIIDFECLLFNCLLKFKDKGLVIRFVGEAAALILRSTPTKASAFFEDQQRKKATFTVVVIPLLLQSAY
jgi:hypothetical protein